MSLKTLDSLPSVYGKRILVRVDFNVPIEGDVILDDSRIVESLPTLLELQKKGAILIILSHLGRPQGKPDRTFSLRPLKDELQKHCSTVIQFSEETVGSSVETLIQSLHPGDIVLLENVRFYPEEEKNDPVFASELAALGDFYVNDAFSVSHRAHASVEGVTHFLPSYAGRLMEKELNALDSALYHPKRPLMALVGGAKISTKLALIKNLVNKVDILAIGGAMAHTFLEAMGHRVGKSLVETDLKEEALEIIHQAKKTGTTLILPEDGVVAPNLNSKEELMIVSVDAVPSTHMILDIGPRTVQRILAAFDGAATLVWNGELGVTEILPFDNGTKEVAQHVASRTKEKHLMSIAGGGDTVRALNQMGCTQDFTYVSMAGGAFLEWLEGRKLPGVEVLENIE